MTPLTSIDLLRIWEEGMDQSQVEKTLRLLAKACAVTDHTEMGRLSIGERDARLLQIREWMFGSRLNNIANCPNCNDTVEWEMTTANLYMQKISPHLSVKTFRLEKDDFIISYRLPDTIDVSKASTDDAYSTDPRKLLSDCILEVNGNEKKSLPVELPDSIWEALSVSIEKEDPMADIRMNVQCPSCSCQWETTFDIVSFLWAEINNWANRILQEVYMLGRWFGWSEQDILRMSPLRRQLYLQKLGT